MHTLSNLGMLSKDEIDQKADLVATLVADGDFDGAEEVVGEIVGQVMGCDEEWEVEAMRQCLERQAMFAQRKNKPQLAYELLLESEAISPNSCTIAVNMVTALRSIPGVPRVEVLKASQKAIAKLEAEESPNPKYLSLAYYYYSCVIEEMVLELFDSWSTGRGEDVSLVKKFHSVTLTYYSSLEYASGTDSGLVEELLSAACEKWSTWLAAHSAELPFVVGLDWSSQVRCAKNFDTTLETASQQTEPQQTAIPEDTQYTDSDQGLSLTDGQENEQEFEQKERNQEHVKGSEQGQPQRYRPLFHAHRSC
eukprot:TRINITY_DN12845_c0_g1_i1.p1 TRINITY_DN12845_c0_g1~~TRINITY_DN12845_c0_g1_i1.p1  ORF type:complete len:308 (+),score=65.87 TRINITY_DN12845_c0_g1_i1:991-1914(+)